jgi:hypothetical protein
MRRHVIIGRYGPGDRGRVALGEGEIGTRLDLIVGERTLDHGVGRALADLARLGVSPSEMGLDVLVLATHDRDERGHRYDAAVLANLHSRRSGLLAEKHKGFVLRILS